MIQARGLACASPEGRPLLEGLDLTVRPGGNLLVTGSSGSGKSRLLRVLAGTERPRRGEVRIAGIGIWPGEGALSLVGRIRMGFAFASGGLLSNLSLEDNVALPLRFLGLPKSEVARRTAGALDRLGLASVARLRPHAVSGAARKHANLARVLALEPELILLDDPLEGLDTVDRAVALELIEGWVGDSRCTLVLASEEVQVLSELEVDRLQLAPAPTLMESP
ncbi:ATP-binding cassette domain-containing protein [Geothrix fuzhouensis]|uniref:ATP-binding cassette domain-containing protein n=1 Tax=Geothrix fuzhouensis TaxID=2966451 RepID=UPI002147DB19|nr:ATP-binding cassette domain-containing protein [Geothrix fuzhouensis]